MRIHPIMSPYTAGDRVRIEIPDPQDPDFSRLHGESGILYEIEGGEFEETARKYRVMLDTGAVVDVFEQDLRPWSISDETTWYVDRFLLRN